jgi:hypothetical protein
MYTYITNNRATKYDGRETVLIRRKQEEQKERNKMTKESKKEGNKMCIAKGNYGVHAQEELKM